MTTFTLHFYAAVMQLRRSGHAPPGARLADSLLLLAWLLLSLAIVAEVRSSRKSTRCGGGGQLGQRQSGGSGGSKAAEEGVPRLKQVPAVDPSSKAASYRGSNSSSSCSSTSSSSSSSSLTWKEVGALLQQPAKLHGRQKKGGMPSEWPKLLAHMTNKNAELHGVPEYMSQAVFRWFAAAYTFNGSEGRSNAALQSPVPPCHFYVDHKYRILYVRNTKTASTSISETLGMKENPKTCKWSNEACWAKCKGKPVCLAYLWDAEELKRVWPDYTVFAFVRNPWARAVSSWHHIHKHGLKPACHDSFAKFAAAPSAYGAKCLGNPSCCLRRFGWILEHMEPQSRCLFDAEGRPAVDFIGRVEHIDEDVQALLELVNSRRPMGAPPLAIKSMPHLMVTQGQEAREEEAKWREYAELYLNTSALKDVRSYFGQDFDRLQFPDWQPARRNGSASEEEPATGRGEGRKPQQPASPSSG